MTEPTHAPIESLLAESAWVRRLARSLASDGPSADDLVQDTWLAALARPPERNRPPRPWLARVMANVARMGARSRSARIEREQSSARSEAQQPDADSAERLEIQRLLVDALRELDEPYRTTVIWRYFDDLSSVEIARRHGIPAGTVRWRLSEGLTRLRASLDGRSGGDRSAWCASCTPLFSSARVAAPYATASGASTTSASTKVAVMTVVQRVAAASIVAVVAAIAVWKLPSDERAARIAYRETPVTALGDPSHSVASMLDAGAVPAARVAGAGVASGATAAVVARPPRAHLRARFVDPNGRRVARVRVLSPSAVAGAPVESDARGEVAFEIDAPVEPEAVVFSAALDGFATHFATVRVERDKEIDLGDVHLTLGGSVAGRVVDADGRPVEDARVLVTGPHHVTHAEWERHDGPSTSPGVCESTSGADGAFRIDGVRAQLVRAWAFRPSMPWVFSEPVDVPAHGTRDGIELVLAAYAPRDCIRGIVLAPDGRPVANASIIARFRSASTNGARTAATGADGRFQIAVLVPDPHDVTAHAPDGQPDVHVTGVPPGGDELVLRFGARPMLRVRALGDHDAPLDAFGVTFMHPGGERSLALDDVRVREHGEATLARPSVPFSVRVWAPGHADVVVGPFESHDGGDAIVCRLRSLPGVHGRVTADGRPVAGARVAWHRMLADGELIEHDGYLSRVAPFTEDDVTTNAAGEFAITAREAGAHAILCDADGFATAELAPIDVDPETGVRGIHLELVRGGAIEGTVLLPRGGDPVGTIVVAHRYDGRPRTARVGRDGRYRFDRLTPGGWRVQRAQREVIEGIAPTVFSIGHDARFDTNVDVRDGATTRFDVRAAEPALLELKLHWNGAPARGWSAAVWSQGARLLADDRRPPGGALDEDGRVAIEVSDPGEYALELTGPMREGVGVTVDAHVSLASGSSPWQLDVACGAVEGVASPVDSATQIDFACVLRERTVVQMRTRTDEHGRFRFASAPIGAGRVRMTWPAETAAERVVVEREVLVRRGETSHVHVP